MRYLQIKPLNEMQLDEINMSPTSLRQLAFKIGARAGMEFEMIVPNVGGIDLEPEYERDDGPDRRARSFSDIEEFFYDGDYNGRGDVRRLIEALQQDYMEWKMDRTADEWDDEGLDYFRDFVANNDLFDREEALDEARDEVITANPDLPTDSEEFQQLVNARINELEEQYVLEEFERQGSPYSDAFEAFAEEKNDDYDESDWLEETMPYMSDVENNYDIRWPYYYDINADQDGELDIDRVADDFSDSIGKDVNASRSYHGATRQAGKYVVEPDGSLEGDDPGDAGLEFVSPPMPLEELLSDLAKVKKWADREGCYTNESTGLHINISVPDYSLEKLDYIKLALLLGDKYVLDQFGRSSNTYAKSAIDKIQDLIRRKPDAAKELLDKMRGHMEDIASKAIHSGTTDKYTSINTKTGYIEFRSPGGDWLGENFDKIENTLLRFTVALNAAIDPDSYREEYLKKLYKLLEPTAETKSIDTIKYFSDYVAGKMPKAALRSFVKQAQLERSVAKGKSTGPMWWEVTNPNNTVASIEVVANNAEEAIASAILPGNYPEWARVKDILKAKPVRPYEAPKAKPAAQDQGNWGIWINAANRFANQPGEYTRGAEVPLYRFPSREAAEQWIEQQRTARPNMRTDIEVREIEPTQSQQFQEPNDNRGDLTPRGPGPWEIYRISDNSSVRELSNTSRPEAEAEARRALGLRAEAPELYGVRTRQQSGRYTYRVFTTDSNQTAGTFQSDGIQGSTAANIAFRNYLSSIGRDSSAGFNYEEIGRERESTPTRTSTVPGQTQQTFTGYWDVKMDNEVVFRVQAETQGEANEKARAWILGRSSEFLRDHEGQEVSVVPRYE